MSNISITVSGMTTAEAAALVALIGGSAAGISTAPGRPAMTTGPAPGNAPPPPMVAPPTAPPAPAVSPPPMAAPPAPPASVPPPAPPPAPAAPAPGGLKQDVLVAMQAWSKAGFKAAGIKRVLTKAGIASIADNTPPATLEWLKWAFSPGADGAYLTPEYLESLQ